tara:strand:+ start:44 stop:1561 length:1518 start_codon:yes stop_codon:yes gene_type:complete
MAQPEKIVDLNKNLSDLNTMRSVGGKKQTIGLRDDVVSSFLSKNENLKVAIQQAYDLFKNIQDDNSAFLDLDESDQVKMVQNGIVNFYIKDAINPYIAAGAKGSWIISLKGAVIFDCGGYGMLGLGHAPDSVLDAMNQPHVMANIMTPSVNQMDFIKSLHKEIGHKRKSGNPFSHFSCVNSGSESVTVAARLADVNAKELTGPGGPYEGYPVKGLTLKESFHGRTDRAARYSDSSMKDYRKTLKSFETENNLITVDPNNIEQLEDVFKKAHREKFFIEAFFMEPVMGEGNPGQAISREFYSKARELTQEHGTLLLIDSIQAGLRAHGVLSIVDYPGFQDLPEPDMETYSKALNAGQFPLSVLAMNKRTSELYRDGIYGNTMTSSPRALDVAITVLNQLTPDLRKNICDRGVELVEKLKSLSDELKGTISAVQGTGLLASCELDKSYKCYGKYSIEEYLRNRGLGVIHGGINSIRFTPCFDISSNEIDLIIDLTKDALINGPRKID